MRFESRMVVNKLVIVWDLTQFSPCRALNM